MLCMRHGVVCNDTMNSGYGCKGRTCSLNQRVTYNSSDGWIVMDVVMILSN